MSSIDESPKWEDTIYQIARDDEVSGGREGIANIQARQLANRLLFLRDMSNEQYDRLKVIINAITGDPEATITSIIIPAKDFDLAIGNASYSMIESRLSGWKFNHGSPSSISKMIALPSHWEKMKISVIWVNLVANTGKVSLSGLVHNWSEGESINITPAGYAAVVDANATPFMAQESLLDLPLTVDPSKYQTIRIGRNGNSASDTLPTTIAILAVRLDKVES